MSIGRLSEPINRIFMEFLCHSLLVDVSTLLFSFAFLTPISFQGQGPACVLPRLYLTRLFELSHPRIPP